MRKTILAIQLLLLLNAPAFASDYYVVTPIPGKAEQLAKIEVILSPGAIPAGLAATNYRYDFNPKLLVTGDPTFDANKVSWSVTGTLPSGLSFSQGVLSGTPSAEFSAQPIQVSATYRSKSSTQAYLLEISDPRPTGFWRFDFKNWGGSADWPGSASITSAGYATACDGTVASGSSTVPWYSSTIYLPYGALAGTSLVRVCLPAKASDVTSLSAPAATTYNSGWMGVSGRGVGVTAGGQKWVLLATASSDTGGVYPSRFTVRYMAVKVANFSPTFSSAGVGKYGNLVMIPFNYQSAP